MRRHDITQPLAGQSEGSYQLEKLNFGGMVTHRGVIALRCKYVDGLSVSEYESMRVSCSICEEVLGSINVWLAGGVVY
jgi:hypothetical protein